jgi:hypothetical protein
MINVHEILFDADYYRDEETSAEEAREQMLDDIFKEVELLINNHYTAVIRPFERTLVKVQFEKDSRATLSPIWATPSERRKLVEMRLQEEERSLKLP